MGNRNSYKVIDSFKDQWILSENFYGSKVLAVSQTTQMLSQVHQVDVPSNFNIEQEFMFYDMRQSSASGNLVNIIATYLDNTYHFKRNHSFKVVTQRLPFNLQDVKNINNSQALFLSYNIFRGLQQICQYLKAPFYVSEKYININYFGVPKIWHR